MRQMILSPPCGTHNVYGFSEYGRFGLGSNYKSQIIAAKESEKEINGTES